ncbi:MAG TPA: glycoside hydrolase family 3 N-terminal domain-containing protein [candidate division Zixibacteria bacterium]|nr:glycoside hydrolase family 3 N-terminal domain-containing protein [candidate division Zixibacteria bacterium]
MLLVFASLAVSCSRQESSATDSPEIASTPVSPSQSATEPRDTDDQEYVPYLDSKLPVAERVSDLMARMTLAEKVGQMTLVEKRSIDEADITDLALGAMLSGGSGYPFDNTPAGWVRMVDGFQARAMASRLGIPLIYGVDSVHGHATLYGAVVFPHNIGLGAARDPELVKRIGRVTAIETAATGIRWNYAPVLAVPQDIRWGRTYEGYSENTNLVAELGQAYLIGLQGNDLADRETILATPKHFVGDGGTTWGSSTTDDYMIDQGVTEVSEAVMRSVHLAPYIDAVDAGAQSIMISFSSWGDTKMHAQDYLINDVLKGELGFEGFVVSDWQGIDQISDDYYQSVVTAINAGVDMNMVPYDYKTFIETLLSAVENGDVTEERIDDAVSRILEVKFKLGLFENPYADPELVRYIGSDEHRQLAREAVSRSLVLLKNEGDLLPIGEEIELIFVGGVAADDIGIQSGGWTIEWQGDVGEITEGTTILEGIESVAPEGVLVYHDSLGRLDNIRTKDDRPIDPDLCIAVAGERPYSEGPGDSVDLSIDEQDLVMLELMAVDCEKLVVVLISGRPIIISNNIDQWDAVAAAWLPGTEGQGVADVLFGEQPFSGKLPYTWPRTVDQLPFDFDHLGTGDDVPLFPFGYGLE